MERRNAPIPPAAAAKDVVTSTKEGAILCFLPGLMEIQTLYESLNLIAEESKNQNCEF